ncbi:hypothetical protein CB1_000245011 [Camelus ferus]|nr:hypothetical protein CB1_000245011 [Camelus ferus]
MKALTSCYSFDKWNTNARVAESPMVQPQLLVEQGKGVLAKRSPISAPLLPCRKPSSPPLPDLTARFRGDRPVMSLVEACEPSGESSQRPELKLFPTPVHTCPHCHPSETDCLPALRSVACPDRLLVEEAAFMNIYVTPQPSLVPTGDTASC